MSTAARPLAPASRARRLVAWLQIVALLPVALAWASAGLGYVVVFLPGIGANLWHGTPADVPSASWLFTGLLVGGGLGLLSLLSALVPVACGFAPTYRLARWEYVGLGAGVAVSLWWLSRLGTHPRRVSDVLQAVVVFCIPCLVAGHVLLRSLQGRAEQRT